MSVQIRLLKSKIHFLNAQIASFHDNGLFSPEEIAALVAPILPQIQDLQEQIISLERNIQTEALTPEKQEL
ncbi:hypothetical protein VS868_11830 [Salinimicrobium sp. 3283s]|uniref:hypothetical protein n=1 Tax=Salinimicrobium sp. 3283s TaxID=3114359 RepID=UPI0031E52847